MWDITIFQEQHFRYYDTGASYIGKPAQIVFTDPVLYYDAEGRQLIPAEEWGGNMTLKDSLPLTVEANVKPFLRIEHDADDATLELLLEAAYDRAEHTLNRGWEAGKVPADIKLSILQIIAFWNENRGDTSAIPEQAEKTLHRYRFLPGL